MKKALLAIMLSASLVGALSAADKKKSDDSETLRHYADPLKFYIGTGVKPKSWDQDQEGQRILAREFNATITMGMMGVNQPEEGRFDFSKMDRTMRFAKEHDMKIWGAALIYRPDSLPQWMHEKMRGGPKHSFSPGQLEDLMKRYIQTVVRHGGDAFYAWGVVNEPLSHRNNPWEIILGQDEYIAKAFRYAREATNVPLVLNETFGQTGIDKGRADEFFGIAKRMKAQGVPIDGLGTEMHLEAHRLDPDYLDQFKNFLRRARELGMPVYITEMDVYQGPPGSVKDPWETQRRIYHDVAATCLADSNCKGMTIWDLSDKDTWLVNKRQEDLHDAKPDLFDDDHQKKPAYYGVLDALKEAAVARH
ncbi:MAG: endo-1,4-beta-xylanase [Acidobacteriia bacterium]|nr:endo-1,4-beta-xylanase [Terriglobia bacterium]